MGRDREFAELLVRIADAYADVDRERHKAQRENARLRELVRSMYYAVHPLDREQFLRNVGEFGIEIGDSHAS